MCILITYLINQPIRYSKHPVHSWLNTSEWWRHQMEIFSALLSLCAGNSPVTGEFPSQRPVTRSFDVFFHQCLNKRWGWGFETPSCSLWRHCNGIGTSLGSWYNILVSAWPNIQSWCDHGFGNNEYSIYDFSIYDFFVHSYPFVVVVCSRTHTTRNLSSLRLQMTRYLEVLGQRQPQRWLQSHAKTTNLIHMSCPSIPSHNRE